MIPTGHPSNAVDIVVTIPSNRKSGNQGQLPSDVQPATDNVVDFKLSLIEKCDLSCNVSLRLSKFSFLHCSGRLPTERDTSAQYNRHRSIPAARSATIRYRRNRPEEHESIMACCRNVCSWLREKEPLYRVERRLTRGCIGLNVPPKNICA